MDLEQEVAALREAAEKSTARLLATDPRDFTNLVDVFTELAKAHSAMSAMPVEDVLDTYACVASSAANSQYRHLG